MRRSPSTTVVSLSSAFMLSLVCALATTLSTVDAMCCTSLALLRCASSLSRARPDSTAMCEYQTSRFEMAGHLAHALPVGQAEGHDGFGAHALGEAPHPPRHDHAGGEALHVPLPGTGERLVEIVAVEDELALGRAEDAEVGEVGVAADLGVQARARGAREVGGHDQGGAPEEGEGRDHHAPVADGHQLGHPGRGLLLEQRHGVGAVGAGLEDGVAVPGGGVPRLLALGLALVLAQVGHHPRHGGRVRSARLHDGHGRSPPRCALVHRSEREATPTSAVRHRAAAASGPAAPFRLPPLAVTMAGREPRPPGPGRQVGAHERAEGKIG